MIIPWGNVQHLMLNEEIVEACRAGRFNVYAVHTVDEAIALLTGVSPDIFHEKVDASLSAFAQAISESGGISEKFPAGPVPETVPPSDPLGTPPEEPPSKPPRTPPSRSSATRETR